MLSQERAWLRSPFSSQIPQSVCSLRGPNWKYFFPVHFQSVFLVLKHIQYLNITASFNLIGTGSGATSGSLGLTLHILWDSFRQISLTSQVIYLVFWFTSEMSYHRSNTQWLLEKGSRVQVMNSKGGWAKCQKELISVEPGWPQRKKKMFFFFKKVDFPILLRDKPVSHCEAAVQDTIITKHCKRET